MTTIRYRSRGQSVYILEEILSKLGYSIKISTYFGKDTDAAVRDFQKKNKLVVDGIVGPKTWARIIKADQESFTFSDKFLQEDDLIAFAKEYDLELAAVKAVNEIESRGKGFLLHGRPVILFEGHVFWRELKKRGIDPKQFTESRLKDVLYEKWTRKHYRGGREEYTRLEKAAGMSDKPEVHEAAYCSASWGSFQIMGFHYKKLGYASVDHFVSEMYVHEREHLKAFGRFIRETSFSGKTLLEWLKLKDWAKFAHGYNGAGYKKNKYDTKLRNAYLKYKN